MRVMVIVKASKSSEAGVMPSERLLTEMGRFNEELAKAGVMLAGEGLKPSAEGARVRFAGARAYRGGRALRRNLGADRRILAVAGEVHGRGDRMGEALSQPARGRQRDPPATPRALLEAVSDPDRAAAKRAFDAMMTMGNIDIAAIEAARRG